MTPTEVLKMLKGKIDAAGLNKCNYAIETSDIEAINQALLLYDVVRQSEQLPAVYPLIDNHRWYAENGTVYNEADEEVRIVLLHDSGSYSNLPHEIAIMIASALNSR